MSLKFYLLLLLIKNEIKIQSKFALFKILISWFTSNKNNYIF
jgi:hypothetical protein